MKKLTNEQIMDYLDGALSTEEAARIEEHLTTDTEDAALVGELKFALGAVKEWHAEEELRVSENFWPNLRDQLGPVPQRSVWSKTAKSFNGWLNSLTPSPRASRWSFGAAVAAAAIVMGIMFLAPKDSIQNIQADGMSAADRAFVTQSLEKHDAYVSSQPVAGDTSSLETGSDDVGEDDTIR